MYNEIVNYYMYILIIFTYTQTTSLKHDDATCTCIRNAAFSTAQKSASGSEEEVQGWPRYTCVQ